MKNAQMHCWLVLSWGYWDDKAQGTYESCTGKQYTTKVEAKRAARQRTLDTGQPSYVAKITNQYDRSVT